MENRAVYAATLLAAVVIEQAERVVTEGDYRDEIAGGEECHEEVAETPNKIKRSESSEYDEDSAREQPVDGHHTAVVGEETDIGLAIVVIADNAGESEEEDGNRHEERSCLANLALQGSLRQCDAVEFGSRVESAEEDDESRARADQKRVGEDAESLNEALLDRMADSCSGRHVRRAAFTRFVREKSALNADHHCGAEATARHLFDAESVDYNQSQHVRKLLDV